MAVGAVEGAAVRMQLDMNVPGRHRMNTGQRGRVMTGVEKVAERFRRGMARRCDTHQQKNRSEKFPHSWTWRPRCAVHVPDVTRRVVLQFEQRRL